MGRRWGKTVLGGAVSLPTAAAGGKVAWIVPTFSNGRPLWDFADMAARPLAKHGLVRVNISERSIRFANGGFLRIYTADRPASILGNSFDLVVIDEAARVKEGVWLETVQPTLADYNGNAFLISSPRGKNWFYREFAKGKQDGVYQYSWNAPSRDNPSPNIQLAAHRAEQLAKAGLLPMNTFQQEWLAEFLDNGGEVFRYIEDRAIAVRQGEAWGDHIYVMGIDWAKKQDWTVVTVIDVTTNALVYLDRFQHIDYTLQVGRILETYNKFKPSIVVPELNSAETPCELLANAGLPVRPFITTNPKKGVIVQALALAFERGDFHILDDDVLKTELQAFEAQELPSGMLRYSAPEGITDDCVMSLCFAYSAVQSVTSDPVMFA